ncbi:MAG TPA: sodium:solute symporter [Vicinamibacterales bacterium]|nr:sodium:solute symporter [Vicinamibacterales bacterium]
MSAIDWSIIGLYLMWIVWDGIRLSRNTDKIDGYFLASKSLPWWAVGLSVMATQLSAITMTSSTGQGYADGIGLLQQYYALPIAMIIISVTFVPFFRNANIYTAYEYLEGRFDARVRSLTALLFLLSRGMATGVVISAPAVVLSVMIGADISTICLLLAVPTAIYTMYGGVQAVAWTDVKQMYLIVFGLVAACVTLIAGLPADISVNDAMHLAGTAGKLQAFNFSTDPSVRFTFWTGTIGALFLFLSYFGTDQSQVQRYLTAKTDDEARTSLFMSAYWKIPLQALVMIIGVLMFVFYLFTPPPMLFNRVHDERVRASARAGEYVALEQRFTAAVGERSGIAQQLTQAEESGDAAALATAQAAFLASEARVKSVRAEAIAFVKDVTGDSTYNDVNYVFPTYIVTQMPVGLIGLLMAAIFAAAMSTIAGELSALSTSTVIDFYRRWVSPDATDERLLRVSRYAMLFWALFASLVAIWAAELGSLIEVVNRFGSFFYGSILGVFLLAIGWSRANAIGALVGLVAGMSVVAYFTVFTTVAFLWHNLIGAVVVFIVGMIVSELTGPRKQESVVG